MTNRLKIDVTAQCVGCRQCELICSIFHEGIFAPWLSRVLVHRNETISHSVPHICHQCIDAKCQKACPNQAITFNENGILTINLELCNGCGKCVVACPFHVMGMNYEKQKAFKCDLCGGEPQCVKVCPEHVLIAEVTPNAKIK